MKIMYIDEAGCPGSLPAAPSSIQPVFCLTGLILDQKRLDPFTRAWVDLKREFFPRLCGPKALPWDWQRAEVKGSEVRRDARSSSRRKRRAALGFLDKTLDLISSHNGLYVSRVWAKHAGGAFKGNAVYTFSVQDLCSRFQCNLDSEDKRGLVIADSRLHPQNSQVSHSVFTMRFRASGDPMPRMIEVPVFGHSENHAGLQVCDILCSSLMFPICAWHFQGNIISNTHIHSRYRQLAERYCPTLKSLQLTTHRAGKVQGGLIVWDGAGKKGAKHLFNTYS